MDELIWLWEHQLFCFEYTVKDKLCLDELGVIEEIVERQLKSYLAFKGDVEQPSLIDYLDIRDRTNGEVLIVSTQVSEIDEEKFELFIIGRNKISRQISCTLFLQVFIQVEKGQLLHIPRNEFLEQSFKHREYKRRVRKKTSLLFNK